MKLFFIFVAVSCIPVIQASIQFSVIDTCMRQIHVVGAGALPASHGPLRIANSFNQTTSPIPLPTPSRSCRLSVSRSATGLKISCQCRHGHSEVPSEIIEGVSHRCMRSCIPSSLSSACESGDLHRFKQQAKSRRDHCCLNTCTGLPDGSTCVRRGPFSAPTGSSTGCVVSFPVQPYGDQFACSCNGRTAVASPILYTGIDKSCLIRCARRRLGNVCVPGRGTRELIDDMLDEFAACCETCRGIALDAGLACGVRT